MATTRRPGRSWAVAVVGGAVAFAVLSAALSNAPDPAARLPEQYRLADLIRSQQATTTRLRDELTGVRDALESEQTRAGVFSGGSLRREREIALGTASSAAGLAPVKGTALTVTLADSSLDAPPSGATVDDLVIHSQDVQAAVNALWRAGATAVAINGQRLVATSAVLCVGNTLLLNGTVHSPPYVITAIGADRGRFQADRLVRRLRSDADTYELTFTVKRTAGAEVPPYEGSTGLRFAQPVPSPAA